MRLGIPKMKTCSICKQELSLSLFHKRTYKTGNIGYQSKCKKCSTDVKKTYYKTFDKSGKETTGKKPVPVKSTEAKVTTPKKLTTEQTDKIPFKNDAINKFSDKVYPIYQTPTAKNRREDTPNFAADAANNRKPFKEQEIMYGTKAQRDSSMASVYKRNIKNFSGTNLLVYPDKNNPYVAPGNTGAGPLVRRKFVTNNAQLRANKRLTGKTGDQ